MSICLSGAALVACGSPGTSLDGMTPGGGSSANGAGAVTVITSGADGGTTGAPAPGASGGAGAGSSGSSADAGTLADAGSGSSGDGGAGAFHQGDAFEYTLVSPSSQMVSAMLDVLAYSASTGPKAVAVNAQGLGFVRTQGDSQATVSQAALEACFVIGGGSPCALLATGNTFALDASALSSSFTFSLAAPTDVTKVPFVQPSVVTTITSGYAAVAGAKAIAISFDGVIVTVPGSSTDVVASSAEAQRLALERCELTAGLAPCTLFAVGTNVVFSPTRPNGAPQIDYARTTLQTNVPGVSDAAFTANVVPYMQGIASGSTGAIFLDDDGDFGTGWSTAAGQGATTAQSGCAQAAGTGGAACFSYATNDTISFTPSDLAAIKTYSLETHCKAMPRTDCAAHQAIGCTTTGSYYTTRTGSVALETCTF